MDETTYYTDYPTEPIGDGNPYHRCAFCGISDPQINMTLTGHRKDCEYRIAKESGQPVPPLSEDAP